MEKNGAGNIADPHDVKENQNNLKII